MTKSLVFLFSGQGSQSFHMGREIVQACPEVRARVEALDGAARARLGYSIVDIMFDSGRRRFDSFDRLLHSNPALYILQVAVADALIAGGAKPAAVLGASLGEIVALTVAGAMTPNEGLEMVIAMSELFERHGPAGGLIAVLTSPDIAAAHPELFAGVEIAGVSGDEHFIAAGPADRLARIEKELGAAGHASVVLPVRFPFHSSHMDPMRPLLQPISAGCEGRGLALPVVSCVTGGTLKDLPAGHLWQIVRAPMQTAAAYRGLEARQASLFVDLSPSGTMSTVAKYNLGQDSASELHAAMTPFGNDWAGYQAVRQRLGLAA